MLVKLDPRAGDKLGDQIDLANELLTKDYVDEVQLQMNDGLKFMRTPMDGDQIRKFIWEGYSNDNCGVRYDINELSIIPFENTVWVVYNNEVIFTTSAYFNPEEELSPECYFTYSIQEYLDDAMDDANEDVMSWFIEWGEENVNNFREDLDY